MRDIHRDGEGCARGGLRCERDGAQAREAFGKAFGLAGDDGVEIAHHGKNGEKARAEIASAQAPAQPSADEAPPHAGARDRRAPTGTLAAWVCAHGGAHDNEVTNKARHARKRALRHRRASGA